MSNLKLITQNMLHRSQQRQVGMSLVELMVAMFIGLLVLLGLVSLFTNSSNLNRAQTGLAALQENGRYALNRIKMDIESAGRRHCASVGLPTDVITDWDQGYEMAYWDIEGVNLGAFSSTNGLPTSASLDNADGNGQLGDTVVTGNYPLDSAFLIRGHECNDTSCDPTVGTGDGNDQATNFRNIGTSDGSRAARTDIFTIRYLSGGHEIIDNNGTTMILNAVPNPTPTGPAIIADCNRTVVTAATWGGNQVSPALGSSSKAASINPKAYAKAFSLNDDFKTVSYFVGIDTDPSDSTRLISSLYRSENGTAQQLVEGVERMDVFYLAQLQTGHVARLTAAQVQTISNGGDFSTYAGCIITPRAKGYAGNGRLANDAGCLWRSIYAIEVHLLMNTVNDSTTASNETYIYSPDGSTRQTPTSLPSGLNPGRMYRREFTAIVPIRSYGL